MGRRTRISDDLINIYGKVFLIGCVWIIICFGVAILKMPGKFKNGVYNTMVVEIGNLSTRIDALSKDLSTYKGIINDRFDKIEEKTKHKK